jgi:glutamyl-tRNA synthetase
MLAFLGWNPGTEQEVFSMDELIQAFSFERVHKAGARFDPEKAKWFNEQYLRATDNSVLAARLLPTLNSKYPADKRSTLEFATGVVQLVKDRVQFENEILDNAPYLFEAPTSYDEKVITKRWNETASSFIQALTKAYEQTTDFTMENCKLVFENTAAEKGIKPGEVLQLFRVIMSGQGSGVDLFGMVALLGKEEVLSRIAVAMDKLGNPAN